MYSNESNLTEDYTIWTDQAELFVEFPTLVVGEISRFAAHFTVLDGHQPVREGSVTVSLIQGNKGIRQTVDAPSSQGIFSPTLQPKQAGLHQLVFDIQTSTWIDRIEIKKVMVHKTIDDAILAPAGDENDGAITFLKEQAWKIEFQTMQTREKEIFDIIHTSGKWTMTPSGYQTLIANATGKVAFQNQSLLPGSMVKKGKTLMIIKSSGLSTNNLKAEIEKSKANLNQAQSAYERKEALFKSDIISKAAFEQVQQKYEISKTEYETLSFGYASGGMQIRAPFDGYLQSIQVGNGEFVEQGTELLTIARSASRVLAIDIGSNYAQKLSHIQNIWFQVNDRWLGLNEVNGKVLSVSKSVSEANPMLTISAQVTQSMVAPIGSLTKVDVALGDPSSTVVVPEIALMEDYGKYSVVVQLSGESFELRNVTIGKRNGDEVEVQKGLKAGEIVVTRGAFQVKMAAASGAVPAHGHAH